MRATSMFPRRLAGALVAALLAGLVIAGCSEPPGGAPDAATIDAAPDAPDPPDGTPIRLPCTGSFGAGMTTTYGRLDGILVAIVPPGTGGCNADSTHVHLQVRVSGAVYDVAVNVDADVSTATREMALTTAPWAEGWHPGVGFNYTLNNIHSSDFTGSTTAQLVSELMAQLQTVNHISIHGTGYSQSGAHLIHRNNGLDGALVIRPLSGVRRVLMFRFANQTF